MILPFSTQINGKPNYFPEKILLGVNKYLGVYQTEKYSNDIINKFNSKPPVNFNSKIHTIRQDKNNRWKAGNKIHFYINCRQPSMFRFAPVLPVVSIQKIEINWVSEVRSLEISKFNPKRLNFVDIIVNDVLLELNGIKLLAQNDGFDTIDDFFEYFNKNFTGKLIHWTNTRY